MFVGIDIGGTKCMFGCESDKTRIFKKYSTGLEFTKIKFIDIVADFISYIQTKSNVTLKQHVNHIVASICGLIDNDGIIGLCELPKLTGTNIKQIISKELNISMNCISTVNDGYAALHASMELFPNETNMATIICGTGIASSFIIDGTILKCNDSVAGWVGGSPVTIINDKNNKRETKILDDICGGKAIVKSLAPILPMDVINDSIDDEKDKEKVIKVLNAAGYYMGVAICICLNMMKCNRIVFAGGVFNFPYFYDAMIKSMNENMLIKELSDTCTMEICKHYNELVCIGTLILAKMEYNGSVIQTGAMKYENKIIVIIDELLTLLTNA